MKRKPPVGNLAAALGTIGVLLYLMSKPSPKIVLLPFLICALAMAAKSVSQILGKDKWTMVFHRIFVAGFLLFWFGFLAAAAYVSVRDKQYSLLVFAVPFWLVGGFVIRNKLLRKKSKKEVSPFRFANAVSSVLVSLVLLAGILLLILGIARIQWGLIFMGAFFLCGGGIFVLVFLSTQGVFDGTKIDVLGLCFGFVFVVAGVGFTVMIYTFADTSGLWVLIPLLMAAAGILQIIKCLKNKK